jgi:inner membrane protein involved in colicin E2 resistance
LTTSFQSQGLDRWRYNFGDAVSGVNDFELTIKTNFKNVDFSNDALAPTSKRRTAAGWDLTWKYSRLVSGSNISLDMPAKLQPGQLAGEISYFAPISLFFFFFLLLMITTLRGIELHPNYFFVAASFFAFHLLLAYLADHVDIHLTFLICSFVSIALVVSYLRAVIGPKFAIREAAGAQFVYLVLFSYAFFLEGFTGLAITIGAIITLFLVMQMTSRVQWGEKF